MAGIYIHIPFCKKRCFYCDFFSSVQSENKDLYVEAVCKELRDRKNYLKEQKIETVYFGGGTPSQLSAGDFEKIFNEIDLSQTIEITLEANPDDLTIDYVHAIRQLPFNRVSLGIQRFNDRELKFLNRRHNAQTAIEAVELLQKTGFGNISIDLMYGLPEDNEMIWRKNLEKALSLSVQHISAYHLIYEEGTPLYKQLKQGLVNPVEEDTSVRLFEILIDKLTEAGFEHYEISNFSCPGYHSRHNTSYWQGKHYFGVGASAHSYNGVSRQWNVASVSQYIQFVNDIRLPEKKGCQVFSGFETIDEKTAYNEFILTRLRMMKGIDFFELLSLFGKVNCDYCLRQSQKYIENQCLEWKDNHLRLIRKGIFVSDGIIAALMR
jgi:oxygen-independent coproporphyrinogen-3 oxidase